MSMVAGWRPWRPNMSMGPEEDEPPPLLELDPRHPEPEVIGTVECLECGAEFFEGDEQATDGSMVAPQLRRCRFLSG